MENNSFKVYISDARMLGYCAKGMRELMELHNLDYVQAVREGIDSDILLNLQDAMVDKIVAEAARRQGRQDGSSRI